MDETIYEDINLGGRSETLEIGGHRLFSTADLDDGFSSIKVPAGLVALVYEHADQASGYGRSVGLMEDHADLGTLGLGDTNSYVQVFAAESDVMARNHATGQTETARVVWARGAVVNGQYVPGYWEKRRGRSRHAPAPAAVSPDALFRAPVKNVRDRSGGVSLSAVRNVSLVRESSSPAVYLVVGDKKFWVESPAEMSALGFEWGKVRVVSDHSLDHLTERRLNAPPRVRPSEISSTAAMITTGSTGSITSTARRVPA